LLEIPTGNARGRHDLRAHGYAAALGANQELDGLPDVASMEAGLSDKGDSMVNPLEIMPVLALAAMIACIPLFADPPARPKAQRRVVPRRGPTVPLISLRGPSRH
jgi:hypothetical protein